MITERNDCGLTSQLDQVLALVRSMPCRCMSVAQLGERDPGCDKCEATEKLEAIRAAVGGEAVAWQCRAKWADGSVGDWSPCSQRFAETKHDIDYEYRALYASPTATVEVGAIQKLANEWRADAVKLRRMAKGDWDSPYHMVSQDSEAHADELVALIGEKA